MRIAVNTFYTNSYEPLAAITTTELQKYCDKHKYDLIVEKIPDGNFHFIKTKTARKLLDEYDLVWTVENDVLVTNHNFKIEDFADGGADFYVCKDVNNYNGGSFIIETSYEGKKWMDIINLSESLYGDEQNYLELYCGEDRFKGICKTLGHPSINSIPYKYYEPSWGYINWEQYEPRKEMPTHEMGNWEVGDFVCHLPGQTLHERIRIFNELKQYIIYE